MPSLRFDERTETSTHCFQPDVTYVVDPDTAEFLIDNFGAKPVEGEQKPETRTATKSRPRKATKK